MNQVINVGRAIIVLTFRDGKKVKFPIQGRYVARTVGPLDKLESIRMPVGVNEEYKRLKDTWTNSKVVQYMTYSWKLEDIINIELTEVSTFNMVVP